MEPPLVQYVRTEDGFDIAFTVAGKGLPFVFMPWPFSHRGLWWETAFGRPLAEALAQRFRLVQYDSRGQGMSTRGLPEDHVIDDYVFDLQAVVDHLVLDRFVLYGGPTFCDVAVRFALQHPERVAALVLGDLSFPHPAQPVPSAFDVMARRDWDTFLHFLVAGFSLQGAPIELPYWRESIERDDWFKMVGSARVSNLAELLPQVSVPTLILNNRRLSGDEPQNAFADYGQAAAAMIPGSRLVLFDGWASIWYPQDNEEPRAVSAIEDFVRDLGLLEEDAGAPVLKREPESARLSPREAEVLRLIARGRSNAKIAEELVISPNTVNRHVSNIYAKTGAANRAEAASYATRNNLA